MSQTLFLLNFILLNNSISRRGQYEKLLILNLLFLIILVVGCNKDSKNQHDNSQYHDEIKKILKIQEKTHQEMVHKSDKVRPKFEKGKVNRYFFKDGQLIISYKLFKNKEQLFYAAYEIKGEKVYYIQDINSKDYIKEHQPDYKDIRTK
ncbi:DUF4467 domain-containing protein [Staphylococcus saccharolyticus]|mgnify:CR=1 FL=1|uniref:DUF4467 domain-containing protein n=1 Tax=Staphylococcus saccharolyticus TaxID=33028 RepID=UPI00102DA068|nr:DUF4467 domain-containing protein [Staphylococcus saccharolyticus]MBL7572803.1 DUF4467 domain-containing protein [Staphylococcus saccharolyticus]MBL7584261.1 DUF4467 domain-containing protein [Staphylococcus saccharolyticus]MBL7638420.1 DUF4467 domain-containing protein [Staphylococcus saccharolyticus]QRJ68076.1 DUF4467 domain-containing protein [Staphylococcus saccharolyticus]TAA93340.1 hypothetical protein DMB74_01610 [Staphylococcus saccharolyticus]